MKLELLYDRAGRSDGTAFVTYQSAEDAKRAVREYDGANANGVLSLPSLFNNSLAVSNSLQANLSA